MPCFVIFPIKLSAYVRSAPVEMHKSANYDTLWYRIGTLDRDTKTITWGDSQSYAHGNNPSLSISADNIIEVHENQFRVLDQIYDKLYYSIGTINSSTKTIEWVNPVQYASGDFPSVTRNGNTVVEMHGSNDGYSIRYKVGVLQGNVIEWGPTYIHDAGRYPSVTMTDNIVVEMHASEFFNRLWYRVGIVDSQTKTIKWDVTHKHDRGLFPSISIDKNLAIEVHESENFPSLYTSIGILNEDTKQITWKNA